jgi:hypothetical protein
LGGDSIKAIQLVSRLRQEGWNLSITDVLRNGDLKSQAALFRPLERIPIQDPQHGPIALSSIQDLFLRKGFYKGENLELGYFHQSVLLDLNESIDVSNIQASMDVLFKHHDILRLKVHPAPEWTAEVTTIDELVLEVEEYDLSELAPENQQKELLSISSLHLTQHFYLCPYRWLENIKLNGHSGILGKLS